MAWTYDPQTDILTVTYGRRDSSLLRSIEAGDAVLDVDGHGGTIRARFLHASRRCAPSLLRDLNGPASPGEDLYSLAEAASTLGVKPYALRHEVLAGGMPATKMHDDWYVRSCIVAFFREILALRRRVVAGHDVKVDSGTLSVPGEEDSGDNTRSSDP